MACLTAAVVAFGIAGCGGGDRPDDKRQVVVSVVADPAAVEPGGRTTLLWRFRLASGWHLYWSGRNDSGFPPEIDLDLPPGWLAAGLQWPAPERLVSAGDILDHVYHHELYLLQRLQAPDDVAPGDAIDVTAHVRWLACKDACVPGKTDVAFSIPVAGRVDGEPSLELRQAKSRLPRPVPDDLLATSWDGSTFTIHAVESPHTEDTRRLTFMPTSDCGDLVDLIADGQGRELALRFTPRAGTAGPVRGLLLIEDEFGQTRPYRIDYPAIELGTPPTGG